MTQQAADIDRQREQLVRETADMLRHLARMGSFITREQAFALAEAARDVGDILDRGRVFRPHTVPPHPLLRRLRRTGKHDDCGRPTYVIL